LPIDPSFLSWRVKRRVGSSFRFVELANDVNENMPDYVLRRLMLALNRKSRAIRGCRVLLLGLAYKPNTSDARESPSLVLADHLLALGAEVRAADPHVKEGQLDARIRLVDLCEEEVAAADAVVLLTDHDAFDYAVVVANASYVLDTRGRLSGDQVERL
jgi:UDP-N-acetyl-D-glucosamine dehydrogenase